MTAARVLVVEDEGIVALDLQHILQRLGFQVTGLATSAEEALACARAKPTDLVLMDIHIRGPADGIEAAHALRRELDLPVVFLTAHGDPATIARATETDPLGYVVKPFKSAQIHSVVELALHRHRIERRLREREHLLATTLAAVGDAVLTTDGAGVVEFANRAAEERFGVVVGRALDAILPPGDDIGDLARRAFGEGHATSVVNVERTLEGRVSSLDCRAAPISDGRRVFGAVLVLTDVSALRDARRQLEWSDRLASLGTLAAGVAHEINNPLTFVAANIDYVRQELEHGRRVSGPPEVTTTLVEALVEANFGADRIAAIVADLRMFTRADASPGPTRIDNVLRWCMAVAGRELRPRARLEARLAETPPVTGDETRLGQVFLNLLVNAAHAIAPGNPTANLVEVSSRVDTDGSVVVSVRDTGVGMSPELARRVFEPFFTTKLFGKGTGLGLSISRSIVEGLGGELTVESTPGAGSTFHVRLRPCASPPPTSPAATVAGTSPGRVLVVDDEPFVVASLRRALSQHHVTTASSAAEARRLLADGARFDVVLCDLMMPNGNGMELEAELAAIDPEQAERMLFLTGGAFTDEAAAFVAARAERVVHKPFDISALRAMVSRAVKAARRAPSG